MFYRTVTQAVFSRLSKVRSRTFHKAPAKRSQHANATCRNIVGRNLLRAFGHRVAMCCDMLGVVGSNLKMVKFESATPNMSQHGGQTHATCCAQQCCDMLCWHVAIVWPGLNILKARSRQRYKYIGWVYWIQRYSTDQTT